MTYPDVALAVATCVYPAGLKRLLDSAWESADIPGRVVVCMDGNEGWARLDQMTRYRGLFSPADRQRLHGANQGMEDYSFLGERGQVELVRNPENLGPVGAFNRLFETCAMAGYVALVNDDVEVRPGWLGCLVAVMQQYPHCVMAGYSNLDVVKRKAFADLEHICHLGAAPLLRGTYLRELLNQRGWVEDPRFKVLTTDIQRMTEPAGRGHDVVCVASPILVSHREHVSLGDWRRDLCMEDHRHEIRYPVNWGAQGRDDRVGRYRFVRMDGARCAILEETP